MPIRFYGEAEVISAIIKITCFLGLIVVSLVITLGGAPDGHRRGFQYWNDPGAWTNFNGITGSTGHFLGFMSAFVNASFSFIGIETVVIAAAEAENPHRSIPKAARRVTYRISFFYILGAILIGMIISPDDPALVSGAGNANASPWTLAIKQAGISALPSIVNVRISSCTELLDCMLIHRCAPSGLHPRLCVVGRQLVLLGRRPHDRRYDD